MKKIVELILFITLLSQLKKKKKQFITKEILTPKSIRSYNINIIYYKKN